jgi:YesN/AraC family two-component response regulator
MVCFRCEMIVKSELENMGIQYVSVKIGEAELVNNITAEQSNLLNAALKKSGLELINDKRSILIEKIKNIIIEMVHYSENRIKVNLSEYLSEKLNHDYTYLSALFSEAKGISIEQFFIKHRIERAKELLTYNEYNINEIADKLHYSSAAHLCNQFKKITNVTPTSFKRLENKHRIAFEYI